MTNPLIGVHAILGEIGIIAFVWVFVEMIKPTRARIKRAQFAAFIGAAFFIASWIVGGYYYLNAYGPDVKPLIKAGPQPWAHAIFTESKEHIFLILPFLSLFAYAILRHFNKTLKDDRNPHARKSVLFISSIIILIGALMALMGYIISSGFRAALEATAG